MTLVIGQLNARHCELSWVLLGKILQERNLDLVLIQEPPPSLYNRRRSIFGYRSFTPMTPVPLVAIVAKSNLMVETRDFCSDRVFGISVASSHGPLLCISAYIQYNTGLGCSDLQRVLGETRQEPFRFLGMDSNGHSPLWGPASQGTNSVGERVEGVLTSEGFFVLNQPDSPETFHSATGAIAWIDITAVSSSLVANIAGWRVEPDVETGSDHHLVVSEVSSRPLKGHVHRCRDWKRVDWNSFNSSLRKNLEGAACLHREPESKADLEAQVAALVSCISAVIRDEVPMRRVCDFSRSWWTPEIDELRKSQTRLYRRWRKFREQSDRIAFLRGRRRLRNAIIESKKRAWRELCSNVENGDHWGMFRRLVRPSGPATVEDLTNDGQRLTSDSDKARALASAFFPRLPPDPDGSAAEDFDEPDDVPEPISQHVPVTRSEVIRAIRHSRAAAAPGSDEISCWLLKKCLFTLLPFLQRVFDGSLRLCHFPVAWRRARVVALRKPGKQTYDIVGSYRPISLLSSVGKLLETIVNRRVMNFVESRQLLSPFQFGFRRGREVLDAGWRLVEDVVSALRARRQVQAVALDLKSAYDTVWHRGLVSKMRKMGIPAYLIFWTRSFLSDRVGAVGVGHATVEVTPECGVPQGSPYSPTLFLIFIDDLLHELGQLERLCFQAFADDLILWLVGDFRRGVIHPILQKALDVAGNWSLTWKLRFNPAKCEAICFCGANTRIRQRFEARLYSAALEHVPCIRYVGLWLDAHLSWHRQIIEATRRAMSRLRALSRAVRAHWGLRGSLFLRIVRGAILPTLFYGAECWAPALCRESLLLTLDRVLGYAGRLAYGLESSTSLDAVLVLAHIMPARFQILRRLLRYMVRHQRDALFAPLPPVGSRFYAAPSEIGRAWLHRLNRSRMTPVTQTWTTRLMHDVIDRGLMAQWQRTWECSDHGEALRLLFPRVDDVWVPWESISRERCTFVARFLTSHCHFGSVSLPWHDDDAHEDCPLCGDTLSRRHIFLECPRLSMPRLFLFESAPCGREMDLSWFARAGQSALGLFLLSVRDIFSEASLDRGALLGE